MKFRSMRMAGVLTLTTVFVNPVEGQQAAAIEQRIPVRGAALYARVIGNGEPVIVLHGGPDFDHRYLLPDLDRLRDLVRLIYYDQRGRGNSAENVRAEDVTLMTELEDLDRVRAHFRLEAPVLLGHSWGALLALEYALRHPARVSGLILMNPAPVSAADLAISRSSYAKQLGADMDRQREIAGSESYLTGDPAAVVARYRIHFKHGLSRVDDFERLMASMKDAFEVQGKSGILKARAVEDRLLLDTWQRPGYDLLPRLRALRIPTVVITGDGDFIPVGVAGNIARAIPGAKLISIAGCGHFTYLECPAAVRAALQDFLRR